MAKILITGSRSGLGLAMATALRAAGHTVYDYDLKDGKDVLMPDVSGITELDVLVNNAGINGINFLEDIDDALWEGVMDTNVKAIYKMTQACLPMLKASKGTVVVTASNASHTPMTSSLAYNCSKASAAMAAKQMARELTRRWGITVFAISPNKLSGTAMSKAIDEQVVRTRGWTMEEAQRYQLAGLLSGHETDPKQIADLLAFLLQSKARHSYLTGCDLQLGL